MPDKKQRIKYRILNYGKYFIKEIIPVTIGILIALSIGNWNQENKEKEYVKDMFDLIDNVVENTTKVFINSFGSSKFYNVSLNFKFFKIF